MSPTAGGGLLQGNASLTATAHQSHTPSKSRIVQPGTELPDALEAWRSFNEENGRRSCQVGYHIRQEIHSQDSVLVVARNSVSYQTLTYVSGNLLLGGRNRTETGRLTGPNDASAQGNATTKTQMAGHTTRAVSTTVKHTCEAAGSCAGPCGSAGSGRSLTWYHWTGRRACRAGACEVSYVISRTDRRQRRAARAGDSGNLQNNSECAVPRGGRKNANARNSALSATLEARKRDQEVPRMVIPYPACRLESLQASGSAFTSVANTWCLHKQHPGHQRMICVRSAVQPYS
ncbi:hypothetical protein VTK56DRAFT_40 [Thermocarpiscus australiensis]